MRALTLLLAAAATVAVTACGSAQKRCADSQRNRAAGKYASLTPEAANDAYLGYAGECLDVCMAALDTEAPLEQTRSSPGCVEANLLVAEVRPLEELDDIQQNCDDGVAVACAWLDAHQADVPRWQAEKAEADRLAAQAAAERAAAASLPADPAAVWDITSFGDAVRSYYYSEGYTLQRDETVGLSVGFADFTLSMQPWVDYAITVVGPANNQVSARLEGVGTDVFTFDKISGDYPGVYAVRLLTRLGDAPDTSPRVIIHGNGRSEGTARVLVFTR